MDALREQLKNLPVLTGQIWLGDRRHSSSEDTDVVLWVNQAGELKLVEAIAKETALEYEFTLMAQAAHQAGGQPERWLSPRAELGLESPEDRVALDVAYISLEQTLDSYLPGFLNSDAPSQLVAELFLAASDFWQRKLWSEVTDIQLARVEGLPITPLWISVLGGEGAARGLALFLNKTAAVAALNEDQATLARSPLLTLSFFDDKESGPRLVREAQAERWPLPEPGLYPWLVSTTRAQGDDPTRQEITLLLEALEALQATVPMSTGYKNYTLRNGRQVRVRWPSAP